MDYPKLFDYWNSTGLFAWKAVILDEHTYSERIRILTKMIWREAWFTAELIWVCCSVLCITSWLQFLLRVIPMGNIHGVMLYSSSSIIITVTHTCHKSDAHHCMAHWNWPNANNENRWAPSTHLFLSSVRSTDPRQQGSVTSSFVHWSMFLQ